MAISWSQIAKHSDGHYAVSNPTVRKQILDLGKYPSLNAAMAAELAADNKTKMEKALGRSVSPTDLYLAHFLGLSGALRFIHDDGEQPATAPAPPCSRVPPLPTIRYFTPRTVARSPSVRFMGKSRPT